MENTINKWRSADLDKSLKEEMDKMTAEELRDAFYKDLEFGTGGMRGIIGPGTNRMNIYTLRKANFGYANYLIDSQKDSKEISVVIAYDCRHKSVDFAIESAKVLCKFGIKVYLFKKITPTPELSFAVRKLKASGGIVITASHNPPQYNGYKIYDNHGCQLVPDLAQIVIDYTSKAPDPLSMKLESFDNLLEKKMISYVEDSIDDQYLAMVKSVSVNKVDTKNLSVVFTPLHGTSKYLGPKLLQELGYNYTLVEEQMVADPEFSTVVSPNPEDKRAFDLSIQYAKKVDADICIATDPDADRVGLAVKDNDDYLLLTGNQTGALLIYYLVNNRHIEKKGVVFNTIVTSPLGMNIAKSHGLEGYSTLTGFKYIGEKAQELENDQTKMFFFGYEESYGYVVKDFVRDKDSLQALLLCSEMASFYKSKGKTLVEVLDDIYKEYGYYFEDLVNINLLGEEGAKKIERTLNYFRNIDSFNDKDLNVVTKEDYELSIRKNIKTKEEEKINLPQSNVIKYILDDDSWFVLRPSGTEPKMKIYISSSSLNMKKAKERNANIKNKVLEIIKGVD